MKNTIAVSLAVIVTLWAFWTEFFPNTVLPIPLPMMPLAQSSSVGTLAWDTWEQYLEVAKAHDLPKVKSLSHQLSPTCQDPVREAECFNLMDSVYGFGSTFKESDFTQVFADEKQIVMMTEYAENPEVGQQAVQIVLFFTRDPDGTPKVLSMRFCFKEPGTAPSNCVETDPKSRDLDNNGWWDSVEALFYR